MRLGLRYGWIVSAAAALAASVFPAAASAVPARAAHAASAAQPAPDNGFAPDSPWNTPLPANVPLAPDSAAIVNNIVQDMQDNFGTWALNTDTYSAPIFTAGPGTPARDWAFSNCQGTGGGQAVADSFTNVPTPPDLIASQGTDAETVIYQPSTDTYWDFWRAQEDASGNWSACWGGKISDYSQNPGIFTSPLGATATGLPLGAFLIRISELQNGVIDHAVNLIPVRTQAGCFSWPANRDDGNTAGSDLPCEGQRFRLDPSFDVSSLYSPVARMVARAMQVYGAIVTDKGGAVVTQAEDPRPFEASHGGVDPYPALMDPQNLYPGYAQYAVLGEIPLNRLEALPLDYGEPGSPSPSPSPTGSPPPTSSPSPAPSGGSCHVTYTRQSEWAGGFTASVTITSTSTVPVSAWTLGFTFPGDQTITSAWGATASQSGQQVTAANASYNGTISPGGDVSFGFQGTWTSNDTSPASFTLNGSPCT